MQNLRACDISYTLTLTWKSEKMDGFTEKKWFVYIGDKHEGPFSLEEIQGQLSQSRVSRDSYVWADGMADWKQMPEVEAFAPLLGVDSVAQVAKPQPMDALPVLEEKTERRADLEEKTGDLNPDELKAAQEIGAAVDEEPTDSIKPSKTKSRLLAVGVTLLVLLTGTLVLFKSGYLGKDQLQDMAIGLSERIPFLQNWISPIPALDGVSAPEYSELQTVARVKALPGGAVQFGLAASTADPLAPVFYLVTNTPEQLTVHVYVVGVPDTLLNQVSFTAEYDVRLTKKTGKTPAVRSADGQPIPRGEYGIFVVAGENQPASVRALLATTQGLAIRVPPGVPKDAKLLAYRSVFLGGSRDGVYSTRLKEFHEKLRTKASNETGEIRQFLTTIESQLLSTQTKFKLLRKRVSGPTRKQWDDFNTEWMGLQEGMDQTFRKWTPDVLTQDFFHGSLYQLVQQAGLSVQRVHELHHSFFVGVSDPKTFEIQLGEALSSANNILSLLKTKLEHVENLAPTPNGMPRRDEP